MKMNIGPPEITTIEELMRYYMTFYPELVRRAPDPMIAYEEGEWAFMRWDVR